MPSIANIPDAWLAGFAGGLLIGIAAIWLYLSLGRIAGISGILYGAVWRDPGNYGWQLAFLGGLILGGWLAMSAGVPMPAGISGTGGTVTLAIGGLLVGFGTRLGKGCTSGHGVCGLGRLSPRSLAAVVVFMAVGVVAATWLRPFITGLFHA